MTQGEKIINGELSDLEVIELIKDLPRDLIRERVNSLRAEWIAISLTESLQRTNKARVLLETADFIEAAFLKTSDTAADERQNKPKRSRGRPKEPLKNKMIDDPNGEKLQKIHAVINGKQGKDFSLIILACIKKGWMTRPTFTQVKDEFGEFGNKSNYNKYLDEKRHTKAELDGAISSLD